MKVSIAMSSYSHPTTGHNILKPLNCLIPLFSIIFAVLNHILPQPPHLSPIIQTTSYLFHTLHEQLNCHITTLCDSSDIRADPRCYKIIKHPLHSTILKEGRLKQTKRKCHQSERQKRKLVLGFPSPKFETQP